MVQHFAMLHSAVHAKGPPSISLLLLSSNYDLDPISACDVFASCTVAGREGWCRDVKHLKFRYVMQYCVIFSHGYFRLGARV